MAKAKQTAEEYATIAAVYGSIGKEKVAFYAGDAGVFVAAKSQILLEATSESLAFLKQNFDYAWNSVFPPAFCDKVPFEISTLKTFLVKRILTEFIIKGTLRFYYIDPNICKARVC